MVYLHLYLLISTIFALIYIMEDLVEMMEYDKIDLFELIVGALIAYVAWPLVLALSIIKTMKDEM